MFNDRGPVKSEHFVYHHYTSLANPKSCMLLFTAHSVILYREEGKKENMNKSSIDGNGYVKNTDYTKGVTFESPLPPSFGSVRRC